MFGQQTPLFYSNIPFRLFSPFPLNIFSKNAVPIHKSLRPLGDRDEIFRLKTSLFLRFLGNLMIGNQGKQGPLSVATP